MSARAVMLNVRGRIARLLVRVAYRCHISATRNTVFKWEQAHPPKDNRRATRGRHRMAKLFFHR